jgi:hypothetical protein
VHTFNLQDALEITQYFGHNGGRSNSKIAAQVGDRLQWKGAKRGALGGAEQARHCGNLEEDLEAVRVDEGVRGVWMRN